MKVRIFLSCFDINTEEIKSRVFTPQVGESRLCKVCNQDVTIIKVGIPYEEKEETKKDSK